MQHTQRTINNIYDIFLVYIFFHSLVWCIALLLGFVSLWFLSVCTDFFFHFDFLFCFYTWFSLCSFLHFFFSPLFMVLFKVLINAATAHSDKEFNSWIAINAIVEAQCVFSLSLLVALFFLCSIFLLLLLFLLLLFVWMGEKTIVFMLFHLMSLANFVVAVRLFVNASVLLLCYKSNCKYGLFVLSAFFFVSFNFFSPSYCLPLYFVYWKCAVATGIDLCIYFIRLWGMRKVWIMAIVDDDSAGMTRILILSTVRLRIISNSFKICWSFLN